MIHFCNAYAWMNGFTTVVQFQWSSGKAKRNNPTALVLDFNKLDCSSWEDEVIYSVHHRFVFS